MSNDVSVVKKNLARRNVRSAEHRAGCNLMRKLEEGLIKNGDFSRDTTEARRQGYPRKECSL